MDEQLEIERLKELARLIEEQRIDMKWEHKIFREIIPVRHNRIDTCQDEYFYRAGKHPPQVSCQEN